MVVSRGFQTGPHTIPTASSASTARQLMISSPWSANFALSCMSLLRCPATPEHFASAALPDAADKRAGRRSIVANDGSCESGAFTRNTQAVACTPMKRQVAIVEDEPAIRDNYAAAFTREGYVVRAYGNRKQAMAALVTRLPDLAVIDISLA